MLFQSPFSPKTIWLVVVFLYDFICRGGLLMLLVNRMKWYESCCDVDGFTLVAVIKLSMAWMCRYCWTLFWWWQLFWWCLINLMALGEKKMNDSKVVGNYVIGWWHWWYSMDVMFLMWNLIGPYKLEMVKIHMIMMHFPLLVLLVV